MLNEFQKCLPKILAEEGGYSNHRLDPGGATQKGVTQAVYDDFRQGKGLKVANVKNISQSEVEEIYRVRYWNLIKGESLPSGVSYTVFDAAVNSGVGQSIKWLQRAVGVNADGVIGPRTINAVKAYHDMDALVDKLCDIRLAFLKQLKTFPTFGKGWSARVARVRSQGKVWADSDTTEDSVDVDSSPKAFISDAKQAPSTTVGASVASVGGGGVAVSALLDQAKDQLMPYSGQNTAIDKVISIVVVVSLVVTVGGIAYGVYASRKKARMKEDIGAI